jgi:hypothetical protein
LWQAYFRYQLIGSALSFICSKHPIAMDKSHFLAEATETGFLQVKEQVPFNLKITYQQFHAKGRSFDLCTFSLDSTF